MTKVFFCCGITTKAVHHPPYPCAPASRRFLAAVGGGNHVAAALVCWSLRAQPVVRRGRASHHGELSRSAPCVPATGGKEKSRWRGQCGGSFLARPGLVVCLTP